jgi:putative intracellular protease/amidase
MVSFIDEEETQVGLAANAPWLIETRLRQAGAVFEHGEPWASYVVVDGNLITGQNPDSAGATAQALLAALRNRGATVPA